MSRTSTSPSDACAPILCQSHSDIAWMREVLAEIVPAIDNVHAWRQLAVMQVDDPIAALLLRVLSRRAVGRTMSEMLAWLSAGASPSGRPCVLLTDVAA